MNSGTDLEARVAAEQRIYADWLDWGTRASLVLLVATFCVYVLSLLEPLVAFADLPKVWALPVDAYLAKTGAPSGWGWLGALGKGDFINLAGVAALEVVTLACYLRILPALLKRGAMLEAALAVAQLIVLVAAASGLFASGH
jgi:hypothetical protein